MLAMRLPLLLCIAIAFKHCHILQINLSCFSLLNNIYIIDTSSIVLHSNTLIKQTLFSELLLEHSRFFGYESPSC